MGYIGSGLFGCRYIWNIGFGQEWLLCSGVKVWMYFFYNYVHLWITLKEFTDQFDKALRKMVENETRADFKSFNSTIKCVSKFSLEKKFQDIYTNAKFKEVQEEFTIIKFCNNSHLKKESAISNYQVIEFDIISEN
jgi:hypothetical protein